MGFLTRVVEDEDLDEAVAARAAETGANSSLFIRAIKATVGEALKPSPRRDRTYCDTPAAIDRSAFAERRSPEFHGHEGLACATHATTKHPTLTVPMEVDGDYLRLDC